MSHPVFPGNCPGNVNKDAKYIVRRGKGGPVIGLVYSSEEDETWYATTEEHPKLVKMVNDVKTGKGLAANGPFYINEYKQVIVPVATGQYEVTYFFAGKYRDKLRFEFEGKTLSGEPFDLAGNPISVGDEWVGPHPGIPYVLTAGGRDVYYEFSPRENVIRKVRLSKRIGAHESHALAAKIAAVKGTDGGRFYVNEYGVMFAPIQEGRAWCYRYLGKLSLKSWFPDPMAEEPENLAKE